MEKYVNKLTGEKIDGVLNVIYCPPWEIVSDGNDNEPEKVEVKKEPQQKKGRPKKVTK